MGCSGNYDADHHDAAYLFGRSKPPDLQPFEGIAIVAGLFAPEDPYASITHFWKADEGDAERTYLEGTYPFLIGSVNFRIQNVPNAYEAATLLAYDGAKFQARYPNDIVGDNLIFYKETGGTVNIADSMATYETHALIYLQYNSLRDLYLGRVWLKWVPDDRVGVVWWNPLWRDIGYVLLTPQQRDYALYDVFGRLCHLLQDMSVPAHAHRDIHGASDEGIRHDYYEKFYASAHYYEFTVSVGQFLNHYLYTQTNSLHFLFYTTNQIADYFSSNGPYNIPGNDTWGGNGTADEIAYLNEWRTWAQSNGLPGVGHPSGGNVNEGNAGPIFQFCYLQAIKATVGLMAWFLKEITGTEVVTIENSFKSGFIFLNNFSGIIDSPGLGLWQIGTTQSLFGPNQHNRQDRNPSNSQLWWVHQTWERLPLPPESINPYQLEVQEFTQMRANYLDYILTSAQTSSIEGGSGGIVRAVGMNTVEGPSFTNQLVRPDVSGRITVSAMPNTGYVFLYWGDGNTQNPRMFTSSPVSANATFKTHLASNSPAALSTNQQRKIGQWRAVNYTDHYTILYESGGQIWDLTSTDLSATSWYPETRVSTNNGVNRNPSMMGRSTYLQYVWHGSDNGIEQIYTKGMISGIEAVAQTTLYPGVSPAPVITIKNRPSSPTNEPDRFVLAWTSAEGIEVYKKPTGSIGPWQRDPISDGLRARLRPSLSDGDNGFAVCLTYDNGRGVYVDVYRQYCMENCWNEWRRTYLQEEIQVPGSAPPNLLFSGKSQVVTFPYPDYYAGIVWQMNEKYPDQDSPEPQPEELNADVIDESQPVPYGIQSVCFQRWHWFHNQWEPLNKFVGTSYQSPTVNSFGGGRLVMLWTDGARVLKTESTNNGGTWTTPSVLRDGVDPNIMSTGGAYAYRGTAGPIYEIGAEILVAPEPQGDDTDTRDIIGVS